MGRPVALRTALLGLGLSPATVRDYLRAIRRAEEWFEGRGLALRTASPGHVAEYASTLPRTAASRELLRASLRRYWEVTNRKNPPVAAIRVPPRPRMVCRAMEDDEATRLVKVMRERADLPALAVAFGLYLGLRRFEIAGMRWDAFSGDWVTFVGKGGVQATLPVHPALVGMMGDTHRNGSPYIFPGRVEGHAHPATIWHWTKLLSAEAGIIGMSTHRLRHHCLTIANDRTGDLRSVQAFARHAKPETTAGYTRASSDRLLAVMRALDYDDNA